MTVLISPAEPEYLRGFGTVSSIPERFGSDFYFAVGEESVGIQRKEIRDLISSLHDGRIAKELGQLKAVDIPVIMIEGDWKWATSGTSLIVNGWSRAQFTGLLFSLQSQGLWVIHTETQTETIESVFALKKWLEKGTHSLARNRPKAESSWGKATSRDWGIHLLQSFEGVGVGVAEKIYDHFEGVPLTWTTTIDGLMEVKGVGKKRAASLIEALPHPLVVVEAVGSISPTARSTPLTQESTVDLASDPSADLT